MSTRHCNAFGEWQPSNVTMCRSYEYVAISMKLSFFPLCASDVLERFRNPRYSKLQDSFTGDSYHVKNSQSDTL